MFQKLFQYLFFQKQWKLVINVTVYKAKGVVISGLHCKVKRCKWNGKDYKFNLELLCCLLKIFSDLTRLTRSIREFNLEIVEFRVFSSLNLASDTCYFDFVYQNIFFQKLFAPFNFETVDFHPISMKYSRWKSFKI